MKKIYLILSVVFLGSVSGFAQGSDCATAVSVTPGTYSADGTLAGGGGGNITGCGYFGGNNADWYEFTPICDGVMSITNNQGQFPSNPSIYNRITVRSGSCNALVCEANGQNTLNGVNVTAGTTYYIEWDDSWSTGNTAIGAPFDWRLDFSVSNAPIPSVSPQVTTAIATWIPFGLEPGWDIQYGVSGFTLGSGTQVNVDSSTAVNQYFIQNLLPETEYCYYISIENTGCWVGPVCFTTDPLCQVPSGITSAPLSTSAILSWQPGGSPGVNTSWDLQYGPPGTPIGDANMLYTGNLASTAYNASGLTTCTDFHMYVREICDATATPPLMSNWVGPVDFSTACLCPEPSALGATSVPTNAFAYDFDWTAGGSETAWNIQWGPVGFLIGQGTIVPVTSNNPATVLGVTPSATLEYYVQADCGTDGTSTWVGPFQFDTDIFCPVPTGLGANQIQTNQANIFWNVSGTTTNYTLEYGEVGFTLGSGTNYTLTSPNAQLQNLTPDTEYCYYVQSNCGPGQDESSLWAGPFCFTTAAGCPAPVVLQVANLSFTSVTLDWQPSGQETEWDVEWGFPGFDPGTGAEEGAGTSTTSSSFYATGLNAAAPYCFYVRAVCGGALGASTWSGPFCFSTTIANDLACNAIELVTDGSINLHTNVGATNNGEDAIAPSYSTAIAQQLGQMAWFDNWQQENQPMEAPVWFKFKAPASGNVEISTLNDVTNEAGTRTEIAMYEVGDCNALSNFNLLAANTYANRFGFNGNPSTDVNAPRGSEILTCGLTPGNFYYVLVDNYSSASTFTVGAEPGIFGISVTDIPAPDGGTAAPLSLCADGSTVDLFTSIVDFSTTTGTWFFPSVTAPTLTLPGDNANVSFAPESGTYTFDYVINNACGGDTVSTTITTTEGPNAGMDGYFSTCNTDDVFLLNHLQGQADFGGTWSDANNVFSVESGVFDAYGQQFGTYNFNYIVAGNGVCPPDTAVVSINLNNNCLGLEDANVSALEVFPNPVNNILTIANLSVEGNATIVLYDAQGKMMITQDVSNHAGNYVIDMSAFEAGLYVIEVNAETSTQKVRVIKQ